VTAPNINAEDLSEFEFDIPCEGEHCDNAAVELCKACGDKRYYAICRECEIFARRWFESKGYVQCAVCQRPWIYFETHYDILPL